MSGDMENTLRKRRYRMLWHLEDHDIIIDMPCYVLDHKFGENVKGFPTVDPVDFVCLRCGKWASEM